MLACEGSVAMSMTRGAKWRGKWSSSAEGAITMSYPENFKAELGSFLKRHGLFLCIPRTLLHFSGLRVALLWNGSP